jgi:hypothetical protein
VKAPTAQKQREGKGGGGGQKGRLVWLGARPFETKIQPAPTNRQLGPCEVITTPVRAPFSCVLRRPFLSSSALLYVPPALRRFRACWSNHGTHATAHHQRRTALLDPYHVIHDDAHQKESIDGNVDCNSYRPLRQWLLVYTRTLLAGYYDVPSFISKAKGILEEKT